MNKQGKIFVISGPSGSGKSTILNKVFEKQDKIFFSISATTRAPREGEVDGVNYHFISRDKFLQMIENDEFLEYAEYVGNLYGTPLKPIYSHAEDGYTVFLDVEVQGKQNVCKKIPEAVSIFIAPPSLEILGQRLRARSTETEEKVIGRLETARKELELAETYDYIVINDELQVAIDEILSIIEKEKSK